MSDSLPGEKAMPLLIIVGPPRSGTSVMGRILGLHPEVGTWIEPYFVWDRDFRDAVDDCRTKEDATPRVRERIRRSFKSFRQSMRVRWVVDKSPRSCLRVPFVRAVFPEARYLFLVRDGRDSVLSMAKQWKAKRGVAEGSRKEGLLKARARLLIRWLRRQPLWRHRLRALWFELGLPYQWLRAGLLSRSRWKGRFGWGPRFRGWEELIDRVSPVEFAAYQWLHCAQGLLQGLGIISEERRILVRYEEFISQPEKTLARIFSLMELGFPPGFMDRLPAIMSDNAGKWRKEFSPEELAGIGPIIQETLAELDYTQEAGWFMAEGGN
jgi:hypothetical protein